MQPISTNLIDFAKGNEGFKEHWYPDRKQKSIGYGTVASEEDVRSNRKLTKEEAEDRLRGELVVHARQVDDLLRRSGITVNENQRNALISFTHNLGPVNTEMLFFKEDGSPRARTPEELVAQFPAWNKVTVNGQKVYDKGVDNRRKKEIALFNTPVAGGETRAPIAKESQVIPGQPAPTAAPSRTPTAQEEKTVAGGGRWQEVAGMTEPGNIDLTNRPIAKNADKTISTVRSISIEEDNKTILIPTVIDGKVVSNDEAIKHYKDTGEHLGKFSDPKTADAYAEKVHREQERQLVRGKVSAAIDPDSAKQIASLEPQVQERATRFMDLANKWAAENGYEVKVTEGYRSPERQNELYAQGRTAPGPRVTNARAGQSHHQSKRAFDVMITKNGKEVDKREVWAQLAKLGKQSGLAWGGDFRSIYDPNHFEYMGG
jgi:GH24 family phage-related lysozyme (muramidase)